MPNQTKAIIAIVSIIILISGVFVFTKSRPAENSTSSISSVSVIASSSKSSLSSSSQLVSSLLKNVSKVIEVLKSSEVANQIDPKLNPIQDIPNVTKLSTDKSIYHQYIKDYLACPTKFYQPLNGGYIYDGLDQYQYKCIPKEEVDKCPSNSLIYGHKPLVGTKFAPFTKDANGNIIPTLNKLSEVELNKYHCVLFYESVGSVSLGEISGYGLGYLPNGLDSKTPGYFSIPKSNLSIKDRITNPALNFAAIPLSSFSKLDQEYISKNFKIN